VGEVYMLLDAAMLLVLIGLYLLCAALVRLADGIIDTQGQERSSE
jgi:hypothetical protein